MDKIFSWLFEKKLRFFIVLFFITLFLRLSSFYYTFLDVDESQFAGFAHVLMDGGLPYRDSVDTKPPLIYLMYAACFFVFGKYNMTGVHGLSLLIAFGISITLYRLAKENGEERGGFFAALFFAVFSTAYLPKFIATSITSVMVLPLALSVYFWFKGERNLSLFHDALAGFCVGVAFLLKYQAGIQLLIFLLYLLFSLKLKKEEITTAVIRGLVLFGVCPAGWNHLWHSLENRRLARFCPVESFGEHQIYSGGCRDDPFFQKSGASWRRLYSFNSPDMGSGRKPFSGKKFFSFPFSPFSFDMVCADIDSGGHGGAFLRPLFYPASSAALPDGLLHRFATMEQANIAKGRNFYADSRPLFLASSGGPEKHRQSFSGRPTF